MLKLNNMNLCEEQGVQFLTFPELEEIDFINHCFTTRVGGVSEGCFDSMNLSFNRGDDDCNVFENYHRICDAVGFDYNSLVAGAQDHHTVVRHVTHKNDGTGIYLPRDMDSVDGLITDDPGVTLVTYHADCTPLYFVDTGNKAIGLSHAGWRGTVSEMALATVKAMQDAFGTDPKDIIAAIGPSIGKCCYEVDTPVIEAIEKLSYIDKNKVLSFVDESHAMLDLWELNSLIMQHAGIPKENIYNGNVCTCCNSDLFFSHRVHGADRGGMAAMLSIKQEI